MADSTGSLLPNVTLPGSDPSRAREMVSLIDQVLAILDPSTTPAARATPARFLLRVAWHEGDRLRARAQYQDGPARSFFQLEAHRARDAGDYARMKGWLGTLGKLAGVPEAPLRDAFLALPSWNAADPAASAWFPAGNQVGTLLEKSDAFGIALTRIAFKKIPAAIPTSIQEQAAYWYKYWKRAGGDPGALQSAFAAEASSLETMLAGA